MMVLEDGFTEIAKSMHSPTVLICDRGTMDASAYLSKDEWEYILSQQGWTVSGLRDRRYDLVCHLTTAADGAEKYYSLDNNTARSETIEQARALDERIKECWLGASKIEYIDNTTDFKGKLNKVLKVICKLVGVSGPIRTRRYFLARPKRPFQPEQAEIHGQTMKQVSPLHGLVPHETFDVQYFYKKLNEKEEEEGEEREDTRLERRRQDGGSTYVLRSKKLKVKYRYLLLFMYVCIYDECAVY